MSKGFGETGVSFCFHNSQLKFMTDIFYAEDFLPDIRGLKRIEEVSQNRIERQITR